MKGTLLHLLASCGPLLVASMALPGISEAANTQPDWALGPFVKLDKPVLSPSPESTFECPIEKKPVRWEAQNVYNPAAVVRQGKVYLL
jgi:hypothetical protein